MAKRKLGASVIILCIAAITLISGTYAWFLVGGTAKLFDMGFGVIEANAALELRGDDPSSTWSDSLTRNDFKMFSFITDEGHYKPVSSKDGLSFLAVGMNKHDFLVTNNEPIGKGTAKDGITDPNDICYNDFTFYVRSVGEEIVSSGEHGAYMVIQLGACKIGADGKLVVEPVTDDDGKIVADGAAHAARVAISIDGASPVLYDTDGETGWNAVTSTFDEGAITDADPYNQIIDSADAGSGNAGLTPVTVNKLTGPSKNDASKEVPIAISLGNIPNNTSSGKEVHVQIWLEGNDKECIDFGDKSIAGKNLFSRITFGVDE